MPPKITEKKLSHGMFGKGVGSGGPHCFEHEWVSNTELSFLRCDRVACNIDINRNLVTFEKAEDLVEAAHELAKAFGGGVVRCKNYFSFSKERMEQNFHYRNFMINVLYSPTVGGENPGLLTFGALAARDKTKAMWNDHITRYPSNANEPWTRWRMNAMHARRHLEREDIAKSPVRFICEVQLGLRVYTDARSGSMHFLYKICRAATPTQLFQDFKIPRKVDMTYEEMQLEAQKAVATEVRRKRKEKDNDVSVHSHSSSNHQQPRCKLF